MSRFNRASRSRLIVDTEQDFDPTGATVEISIDGGAWVAATWEGAATQRNVREGGATKTKWARAARTSAYFAGPDVTVLAGATVLTLGRHNTRTRVIGSDTLVNDSGPIDVA